MREVKFTRKFDGKEFALVSDPYGTNSRAAGLIKERYVKSGYLVRMPVNTSLPYIYPEGRYFVYVRKK